jgi:hypothetical protein
MSAKALVSVLGRLGFLVCLLVLSGGGAAAATAACPSQPKNADGTTIDTPTAGQVVTSPFMIKGSYNGSFEGVVPIRILNAQGGTLISANTMNEGAVLAPYQQTVTFSVAAATPACIVVYRENGGTGALTPLARIPVTLAPVAGLPNTGGSTIFPALAIFALILLATGGAIRMSARHSRSSG